MRSRTTRTRKDKYSTGHDCFFGLPNLKVSRLGLTAYRSNLVSLEAELVTPLHRSVKLGVVPCKLIYGLNTAMFKSRQESPELMMGNDVLRGTYGGAPQWNRP